MFWFTSAGMTRAGAMTLGGMVADVGVDVITACGWEDFSTYIHATIANAATAKMIAPEMRRGLFTVKIPAP